MAKNVPASKFTELKGLDRISQIVHEMNCLFRPISQDDVGIDGEIEVVTAKPDGKGFQTSGGIIKVQAKSGASYVKKDSDTSFATPVRMDDLEYWNNCTFPVFFIVYHPKDDVLYFKEVKTYIRQTPNVFQPPLEVVFDKASDLFSSSAKESVCRHAHVSPPRLSFEAKERLFSNLLPIRRLPEWLTSAETECKTQQEIKDKVSGYTPPCCIVGTRIYTLSDLRHDLNVLRTCCDVESIDDVSVSAWLDDGTMQGDFVFLINQLFGSHRHRLGLRYNPHFRRTYFPRENEKDKEFSRVWTSPRTGRSDRRTVAKHYQYGKFTFWRHLAAEFHFQNFGDEWFLQVQPKYLFTDDGERPSDPEMVGPYTTSQKALEHNPQVLNHVLFWAHTLAGGKQRIELALFGKPLVIIEREPETCIADFAIPLDPATYEEKPPSGQLSLFGWDDGEERTDEY